MKAMVTFPVVHQQTCGNCRVSLGIERLLDNVVDMTEDAYGFPSIIVRCPVCKTLMEWEMHCN
jgi:hypothetical protein